MHPHQSAPYESLYDFFNMKWSPTIGWMAGKEEKKSPSVCHQLITPSPQSVYALLTAIVRMVLNESNDRHRPHQPASRFIAIVLYVGV